MTDDVCQTFTFITRRTSVMIYDRIDQIRRCSSVSDYDVKLSQKHDYQQIRTLNWFRYNTKKAFDKAHIDLFVKFDDVKINHESNCVLCSRNWVCLKFSNLQHIENAFMLSFWDSNRLMFQRKNHITTFMRAFAWFENKFWFKNDIAFDNFLNCKLFKLMNASHLCHQNHCVISDHVIYENTKINQNRKFCRQYVMHLRNKSKNIFFHCTMHNFFCKLQICVFFYRLKFALIN